MDQTFTNDCRRLVRLWQAGDLFAYQDEAELVAARHSVPYGLVGQTVRYLLGVTGD